MDRLDRLETYKTTISSPYGADYNIGFVYEDISSWDEKPTLILPTIRNIPYFDDISPAVFTHYINGEDFEVKALFHNNDYWVRGDYTHVSVTDLHSKFLFDAVTAGTIARDPERVLVIIDEHHDISYSETNSLNNIDIGNWGFAGFVLNYWSEIIHINSGHDNRKVTHEDFSVRTGKGTYKIPYTSIPYPLARKEFRRRLRKAEKIIFTFDSDFCWCYSNAEIQFTPFDPKVNVLRALLSDLQELMISGDVQVDLIHYSSSPDYNRKYLFPVWSIFTKGLEVH